MSYRSSHCESCGWKDEDKFPKMRIRCPKCGNNFAKEAVIHRYSLDKNKRKLRYSIKSRYAKRRHSRYGQSRFYGRAPLLPVALAIYVVLLNEKGQSIFSREHAFSTVFMIMVQFIVLLKWKGMIKFYRTLFRYIRFGFYKRYKSKNSKQ